MVAKGQGSDQHYTMNRTKTPLNACARASLLAATLLLGLSASAQLLNTLAEGDLLFVAPSRPNAITEVTHGIDRQPVDHVGIVHRIGGDQGPLFVIEAIPGAGVVLTPIDSLQQRECGARLLVGRVRNMDVHRSVRCALHYVGRPYDDVYHADDKAIYCSELVQLACVGTDGQAVFECVPMSFSDASGHITDHWVSFYAARGLPVPEGQPGTNPGQLSRHPRVTIIAPLK